MRLYLEHRNVRRCCPSGARAHRGCRGCRCSGGLGSSQFAKTENVKIKARLWRTRVCGLGLTTHRWAWLFHASKTTTVQFTESAHSSGLEPRDEPLLWAHSWTSHHTGCYVRDTCQPEGTCEVGGGRMWIRGTLFISLLVAITYRNMSMLAHSSRCESVG